MLGISILVTVLLDKYLFYRPTYRLLADWRSHGLDLSLGTLTDGLKRMVPLLEPVYEADVMKTWPCADFSFIRDLLRILFWCKPVFAGIEPILPTFLGTSPRRP